MRPRFDCTYGQYGFDGILDLCIAIYDTFDVLARDADANPMTAFPIRAVLLFGRDRRDVEGAWLRNLKGPIPATRLCLSSLGYTSCVEMQPGPA